jgi:hypothetical protein
VRPAGVRRRRTQSAIPPVNASSAKIVAASTGGGISPEPMPGDPAAEEAAVTRNFVRPGAPNVCRPRVVTCVPAAGTRLQASMPGSAPEG